jgi:excisionase family DNA binding protein
MRMIKFLSIPEYSKMTGASRASIEKMIKDGTLTAVKTEGGGQVRIKYEENSEFIELKNKLNNLETIVLKLSEHFGVKV